MHVPLLKTLDCSFVLDWAMLLKCIWNFHICLIKALSQELSHHVRMSIQKCVGGPGGHK